MNQQCIKKSCLSLTSHHLQSSETLSLKGLEFGLRVGIGTPSTIKYNEYPHINHHYSYLISYKIGLFHQVFIWPNNNQMGLMNLRAPSVQDQQNVKPRSHGNGQGMERIQAQPMTTKSKRSLALNMPFIPRVMLIIFKKIIIIICIQNFIMHHHDMPTSIYMSKKL